MRCTSTLSHTTYHVIIPFFQSGGAIEGCSSLALNELAFIYQDTLCSYEYVQGLIFSGDGAGIFSGSAPSVGLCRTASTPSDSWLTSGHREQVYWLSSSAAGNLLDVDIRGVPKNSSDSIGSEAYRAWYVPGPPCQIKSNHVNGMFWHLRRSLGQLQLTKLFVGRGRAKLEGTYQATPMESLREFFAISST